MFRLMTSADRRLAAISNVVRVRVEFSKKRLNTLLPRRSGTFFTSRSVTSAKGSAVSRICSRISRGSPSMDSRCCSSPLALSCGLPAVLSATFQLQRKLALGGACQAHRLSAGACDVRAAVLRADRQLPAAAVDENDQRDALRPAVVEQLVHGGADRAAGVKHVIHQQQLAPLDVERNLGALRIVL